MKTSATRMRKKHTLVAFGKCRGKDQTRAPGKLLTGEWEMRTLGKGSNPCHRELDLLCTAQNPKLPHTENPYGRAFLASLLNKGQTPSSLGS